LLNDFNPHSDTVTGSAGVLPEKEVVLRLGSDGWPVPAELFFAACDIDV
jgi:hypothetical protein